MLAPKRGASGAVLKVSGSSQVTTMSERTPASARMVSVAAARSGNCSPSGKLPVANSATRSLT
ncbi:hypothetical protein [Sorangium sp. So ce145]|uniref:hypothetical protein n=1 Tax=Sorangium sp. So ce145 TaxID=3133285 RepID=UPI003F5ECFB6